MEHMDEVGHPHRGGPGNPLERLGTVAWQALMLLGLSAIAIGVVALVWPGRTLLVLGVLFGIYLLISGAMQIVAAFGTFVSAGMRVLLIVVGTLSMALGLLCFRNSLHNSVLLLSLWIGIGFLMYGIATMVTAAEMRSGWGVFLGLLATAGGVIVLAWPIGSIVTLAVFTGIWLIAVGLTEVIHAFTLRGLVRSSGSSRRHAAAGV
ncbi:HdeD family acid-resistance protein [Streptomyces sp. AN091965]|uniref:HdeD family acid-resistance protein n=1 Tax=Streptomyces sp. AN091965 TaxID=2927803 RepID=UPI001F61E1AD|nr:DUF308 domain-containing protein [Streptomyces sp. AN091965]MCI3928019.1 DUF308 domain-containing protein [Streptomyces sp. AN091965]